MLAARRLSIWRNRYEIVADGQPLAIWDGRSWRGGGTFDLLGRHYEVRSSGWGTRFDMTDESGLPIATAQRVGRKRWTVQAGGATYRFQRASWRQEQLLADSPDGTDNRPAGTVRRVSAWRSDVVADLPNLAMTLQVFVVVVVLTMWNARDAAVAGAV
jgi:hypothetical protein